MRYELLHGKLFQTLNENRQWILRNKCRECVVLLNYPDI